MNKNLSLTTHKEKIRKIHKFKVPSTTFEASDYIGMIWWQECTVTKSPVTTSLLKKDLEYTLVKGTVNIQSFYLLSLPTNTQAVEWCINEYTVTSLSSL